MKLFLAFLAHESKLQLRSGRFRLLAVVYTIISVAPVAVPIVVSRQASYLLGSSMYAAMIDFLQPLTTAVLAAIFSIDAISREQQERSFQVVSLAPASSSGYALRRWLS